jgi:hypothetical protein
MESYNNLSHRSLSILQGLVMEQQAQHPRDSELGDLWYQLQVLKAAREASLAQEVAL